MILQINQEPILHPAYTDNNIQIFLKNLAHQFKQFCKILPFIQVHVFAYMKTIDVYQNERFCCLEN